LVLITGLGTLLLTGCGGPVPEFPLDGDLSQENLRWLEARMKECGKRKTDTGILALRVRFVPLAWLGSQGVALSKGHEDKTYWSSRAGPYAYSRVQCVPIPLPLYLNVTYVSYDFTGEHVWTSRHRLLLAGMLGGWGDFVYRDPRTVPGPRVGSCLMGPPVADLLPARWYFDGKQGRYWQILWGTLGHISTDRSRTLVLLGYVPIKYWRAGPDAAPASR
jgi:hypothetical protein